MDLQAIPFTAIVEYSRIYEIEDLDEFAYLMRLMDDLFLELSAAVNAKERGDKSASGTTAKKY